MRVGEDQEEVWVCAFLGLVFGQVLLLLVAQSALVLLVHLYPILPSKPPLIVCNTTHTRTDKHIHTHEDTQKSFSAYSGF